MDSDIVAVAQDLARLVAAQVAPEEDELFGMLDDAYRRDPDRLAAGAQGRDEMLGFGVEAFAALLTPVVLAAVSEVVRYVAEQAGGAVRMRLALRRGRSEPGTAPAGGIQPLDGAQLTRVRAIVLDKCAQAGVDGGRSQLLADSVVVALRTGI